MPVTINGTTGIVSPGVDSTNLILDGSTSGSITMLAPAVAGTNTQTLVAVTDTLAPVVRGTAVASTSGTSIEFTGIPSWVKRITVMFSGVSTNGASNIQIQIGSGSFTTSGYSSCGTAVAAASATNAATSTTGLLVEASGNAAAVRFGNIVLINVTGNTWNSSSVLSSSPTPISFQGAGGISLGGTLDRVRITTVNGTDTFDAGTINIIYE